MNWRIITKIKGKGGEQYLQITNDIDTIDFISQDDYLKIIGVTIGKRNIFCPIAIPNIKEGIFNVKKKTRISKSCNF